RKWTLFTKCVASKLDFEKAEADAIAAQAKVEASKAKVNQARAEEEAKMASVDKIAAEQRAKIESTRSSREEAVQKLKVAEKELLDARTKAERQKTQVVVAPRDGYILRVHAANSADLLSQGDPLIELIPDTDRLAAELWVGGNDAPLITAGRKVRLQFEGWPAVQSAGWPSVAVGTFGGVVSFVDAQGGADGRFRLLISPDPDDVQWPERKFLRQGARATGWILLEDVSLGYEIWRQLNAFPPSVAMSPAKPAEKPKSKPKEGTDK
ncbi:MAG: HlyD family efflux transporter periplasmic adaptor subunit, partial [Planctomycetota bacterium]